MEQIKKIGIIDKEALSAKYYFSSLLEQARHRELLSDKEMERIQKETYLLLAKETEHYNHGKSSSIRIETAKDLLSSILFTVSMALKTYQDPLDAITALQENPLENLFDTGMRHIYAKIVSTRAIHNRIARHLFSTPNIYYQSTVIDAVYGFFKLYCPAFAAQEIHITADYPTCNGEDDLDGIEFIHQYVYHLYYENLFCTKFPEKTIHHLLCGLHENYQNLLINLYEPVLTVSLACALQGKDIRALSIGKHDFAALEWQFQTASAEETAELLHRALKKVVTDLELSEDLSNYLEQSLPAITASIKSASATKTLDKIFLIPSYPENEGQLIFSYGEKMDNDSYRQIITEIWQSETVADIIDIIQEEIRSLADLEDILLDGDLSEDTMTAVFQLLSPTEYAALKKHYPKTYDLNTLREKERRLYLALEKFTSSLPKMQQVYLEKMIEQLTT